MSTLFSFLCCSSTPDILKIAANKRNQSYVLKYKWKKVLLLESDKDLIPLHYHFMKEPLLI